MRAGRPRMPRVPGLHVLVVATAAVAAAGCATAGGTARPTLASPTPVFSAVVMLHGRPMALHLASPPAPRSETLVIYASGDGGWFGAAVDMFQAIAAQGYRTVGFSSRAFLRIDRPPHAALNARQLADDYAAILARALDALGMPPGTPAILMGWSRGAAFAAIAGSEPGLRSRTRGVVAIGLGADENLRFDPDDDDDDDGRRAASSRPMAPFEPYARLRTLEPLRCAVIQAEHDEYLPAVQARELFGSDTPTRRMYSVAARNHRFSGGRDAFFAALANALSWVDGVNPSSN